MDGYQELANAIVAQAGWDYMEAMEILRQCPDAREARREARRIERFMRSAWFGKLTKADPEYLIRKMRKETGDGSVSPFCGKRDTEPSPVSSRDTEPSPVSLKAGKKKEGKAHGKQRTGE